MMEVEMESKMICDGSSAQVPRGQVSVAGEALCPVCHRPFIVLVSADAPTIGRIPVHAALEEDLTGLENLEALFQDQEEPEKPSVVVPLFPTTGPHKIRDPRPPPRPPAPVATPAISGWRRVGRVLGWLVLIGVPGAILSGIVALTTWLFW